MVFHFRIDLLSLLFLKKDFTTTRPTSPIRVKMRHLVAPRKAVGGLYIN